MYSTRIQNLKANESQIKIEKQKRDSRLDARSLTTTTTTTTAAAAAAAAAPTKAGLLVSSPGPKDKRQQDQEKETKRASRLDTDL